MADMLQQRSIQPGTWSCRRQSVRHCRYTAVKVHAAARASTILAFMPKELSQITEPAAQQMAARIQRTPVRIPSLPIPALQTAYVGPTAQQQQQQSGLPPVVLLHGFDSSCMEFRRLYPLLEAQTDTWAVDLVGWGFSEYTPFVQNTDLIIAPQQKREHLHAFWQQHIKRPMVLVGGSLGGAIALDFALAYPDAVDRIVLIDAQGFIDGIGPMSTMPRPLAAAGVWVLRTEQLRMAANKMAYHDPKFATEDAMRVGRLHTHLPGWTDANIAFMRSGGYSISKQIKNVQQPTLVMWGRQDKILDPQYAQQFEATLPNCELRWIEDCGHCAHLEQPTVAAAKILEFIGSSVSSKQDGVLEAAIDAAIVAPAATA